MRRIITAALLTLIALSTGAQGQEPFFLQSIRVTADFRNAPLADVLNDLLRDKDVLFVFVEGQISDLQTTAHLVDVPLGDALDALLGVHGLTHGVVGGNIVVIGRPGALRVSGPWANGYASPSDEMLTGTTIAQTTRSLYTGQVWTLGDLQITLMTVGEDDPTVTHDETVTAIIDTPNTSAEVTLCGWRDHVQENFHIRLGGVDAADGMAMIDVTTVTPPE